MLGAGAAGILRRGGRIEFAPAVEEPEQVFLRYGYRLTVTTPMLPTANDLQLIRIPKFIINFMYKKSMRSYSICTFNYNK